MSSGTVPAAPLPTVKSLFASLFADGGAAGRPWKNGDSVVHVFDRGASALAESIRVHAATEGPEVWLPDYFCNEALPPIRALGSRIHFYAIGADFFPDWGSLSDAVAKVHGSQILVVVDYFGLVFPASRAESFCSERSITLVEDAAHCLLARASDASSHAVVYSPRKLLAIPAGGLLTMPASAKSQSKVTETDGTAAALTWTARRLLQRLMRLLGMSWHRRWRAAAPGDSGAPASTAIRGLSTMGKRLLAAEQIRLIEISHHRRRNYRNLVATIASAQSVKAIWPILSDDVCPFVLPLDSGGDGEALERHLRREGIPAYRWPDLPPEVLANPGSHTLAVAHSQRLVMVPIHQSLMESDIARMGDAILRFDRRGA